MKKTLYLFSGGGLRRLDDNLYCEDPGGGRIIPLAEVSDIMLFGPAAINQKLLEFLSFKGIIIHFFSATGGYTGAFYPGGRTGSPEILLKQAEFNLNETKRVELARLFVQGAYGNVNRLLQYYHRRGRAVGEYLTAIENLAEGIELSTDLGSLVALKDTLHETYYRSFDLIIGDEMFKFGERSSRPPKNPLNALISFGNSLMYAVCLNEIYKTRLDPRIGFLHSENFRPQMLNLDIAEIFKPVLSDRVILQCLLRRQITAADFRDLAGGVALNDRAKKVISGELNMRLAAGEIPGGQVRYLSYRQLIRRELQNLERHLTGEGDYEPFQGPGDQ